MHILVIPTAYPSKQRPVSGVFYQEQVEALRRAGHQVGVITAPRIIETWGMMKDTKRLPPLMTAEASNEYRLHHGWFPRIFPLITARLHKNAIEKAFQQYCEAQGQPDIIHAHNVFYSGYMASVIRNRHHIPAVITEHSSNFMRGRVFLPAQHHVAKQSFQGVDKTLAVGQSLVKKLEELYHIKVESLHNVVNTDFFFPSPVPDSANFQFALVAHLRPLKCVDNLIQAFVQAFPDAEDCILKIGGAGQELDNLKALVQHLNCEDRVQFLGRLNREEVRDLFQQSQVIVSSSETETFGITLIEAMSCGKPVIATRSGGPEGFVTRETGILVSVNDVDALANALMTMRENYQNYNSETIRQYCENNFSEAAIVSRLETIYRSIQR